MEKKQPGNTGQKKTVIAELSVDNVKNTLRRDFEELKQFFLDEERLRKLENMKPFKRSLLVAWWLLKSMFLRLTVTRRLLLVLGMTLLMINLSWVTKGADIRFDSYFKILGGLVFLFILMLELKDKLLAHDELAAGRQVQLALMPEASPKIPGWDVWLYSMPANDVGGDLVDYIPVDKDRFGLVLGDVAGKGLPAALFMAKLQATLRALVTEFDSAAELGDKINEIFHRDIISKSFASLVYLELEPNSGRISLLNAGHPPPLIIREGKIQPTGKGNIGLGIRADTRYKTKDISLEQEDFLIVYSDGVSEAQDEKDEFFGTERLLRILSETADLSAVEVGEKILTAVENFVGEAPRHDDLSLMILQRR
ncbi:MAG: serine/threonine-protein phosphatase [Candidatus Aminicenantes bacterium]|nr:serine/threonine-protein phosphatase [Candidatus Aminicenantes bacterium]